MNRGKNFCMNIYKITSIIPVKNDEIVYVYIGTSAST